MNTYMHVRTCARMCAYAYVYMYVCVRVCKCVCVFMGHGGWKDILRTVSLNLQESRII